MLRNLKVSAINRDQAIISSVTPLAMLKNDLKKREVKLVELAVAVVSQNNQHDDTKEGQKHLPSQVRYKQLLG